jgi:hypothetical protein
LAAVLSQGIAFAPYAASDEYAKAGLTFSSLIMIAGRTIMLYRISLGAAALVAALCVTIVDSKAWDDSKYPDFSRQWRPIGGPGRFDMSKPAGRGQQAPLTAEYQAIFEANLRDQAEGGQGTSATYTCISPGMRVTNGYGEMEFVVTPNTTHILIRHIDDDRRIFTDGVIGLRSSIRPFSAIQSVNGSIPTAMAATMCLRSRRGGRSKDLAHSTAAACHCTPTIRLSSRSGFTSTRAIPMSPMTKSR